jgi:hypothetical protein
MLSNGKVEVSYVRHHVRPAVSGGLVSGTSSIVTDEIQLTRRICSATGGWTARKSLKERAPSQSARRAVNFRRKYPRLAIGVSGPLKGQSFRRCRRSSETPKAYSTARMQVSRRHTFGPSAPLTLPTVDLVISGQGYTLLEATIRVGSPANVVSGNEHAKSAVEVWFRKKRVSQRFPIGV